MLHLSIAWHLIEQSCKSAVVWSGLKICLDLGVNKQRVYLTGRPKSITTANAIAKLCKRDIFSSLSDGCITVISSMEELMLSQFQSLGNNMLYRMIVSVLLCNTLV